VARTQQPGDYQNLHAVIPIMPEQLAKTDPFEQIKGGNRRAAADDDDLIVVWDLEKQGYWVALHEGQAP
jgi:hypothetical protein